MASPPSQSQQQPNTDKSQQHPNSDKSQQQPISDKTQQQPNSDKSQQQPKTEKENQQQPSAAPTEPSNTTARKMFRNIKPRYAPLEALSIPGDNSISAQRVTERDCFGFLEKARDQAYDDYKEIMMQRRVALFAWCASYQYHW